MKRHKPRLGFIYLPRTKGVFRLPRRLVIKLGALRCLVVDINYRFEARQSGTLSCDPMFVKL